MYSSTKTNKKPVKTTKKKTLFLIVTLVLAAVLLVVVLEATHRIHLFGDDLDGPSTTLNQNTKGQGKPADKAPSATTNPAGEDQGGTATSEKNGDTPTQPSTTLHAPEGTFVSNHRPSLSDPNQDLEQSTCTTTPGATCHIRFTRDGVTKQLPVKATDAGGAAYWSWRLSDMGITKGVWKVTAVATLNGQTKTTDDALNLEVTD